METPSKTIPPTERPPEPPADVLLKAGLSVTQIAVLACVLGKSAGKGIELPAKSHLYEKEGTPTRVKSLADCANLIALRQNGLRDALVTSLKAVADQVQPAIPTLDRGAHGVGGWKKF